MAEKELNSIAPKSPEAESDPIEVQHHFELKDFQGKKQVEEVVAKYVKALIEAGKLVFPAEIDNLDRLSVEQLATLIEKIPEPNQKNPITLRVSRRGLIRGIASDSKFEEIKPQELTLSAQLTLALETAARFHLIVNNLPEKGFANKTKKAVAKFKAKDAEKQALQLIWENRNYDSSNQTKKVIGLSATALLALIAVSCKVSPPEINNNYPTAVVIDEDPDISNPDDEDPDDINQIPTPTVKPTEVISATPESFTSQQSALREAGYTIQSTEDGTQLINRENKVVIRSTEAATITITTADQETLSFPQEAFEARDTIVAGVEHVLTIKNTEGEVIYFFLERTGQWVAPLEIFTDARETENYPEIDLADIESGRLLISEALVAQPFPEGTLVLDDLWWVLSTGIQYDYTIQLVGITHGTNDDAWTAMKDIITHETDPRRWTNFSRTTTPEGKEALIGTQQMLMPDGKTSVLFHYIFGPEWPWEEDYRPGNQTPRNLVYGVFLGQTNNSEDRLSMTARLMPYVAYGNFTGSVSGQFIGPDFVSEASAPDELYHASEGGPLASNPDLVDLFNTKFPEIKELGGLGFVGPASPEDINSLQYEILMAATPQFPMDYWQ